MQFLMGLNQVYDNGRSQIPKMDPLPTTRKAFSMVLRIETQKHVSISYGTNDVDASTMLAK